MTVGDTIDETTLNIKEAIAFHLDGMAQDNDPIPPQYTVLAVSVSVPTPAALALSADG